MAKVIKATVQLEVDGQLVRGFPVARRLVVDEVQSFSVDVASGGFSDLPVSFLTDKQVFLLQPAGNTVVRFANGASGDITINAGGFLLLVDGSASDLEANPTSSTVVDGTVGGT